MENEREKNLLKAIEAAGEKIRKIEDDYYILKYSAGIKDDEIKSLKEKIAGLEKRVHEQAQKILELTED